MSDVTARPRLGRRIVVTGRAGSGKSTFSQVLSARTGLPVIHLDVHYWKPGWAEPSADEWRVTHRGLIAGDTWIADGDYVSTLEERLARADTVVFLDIPWWVCARRAFVRGIRRRPPDFQPPDGCRESALRRLRSEWLLAARICRLRRSERDRELDIVSRYEDRLAVFVVRSNRSASALLRR